MRTFTLKERVLSRLNLLPIPIYDAFASPLFGHVLAAAVRSHVAEALPASVVEIARQTDLHPHAVPLILGALTKAGYARAKDTQFVLTGAGRKWLLKSSPHYLGNFIRYVELLYSHWQYLGETLADGEPPTTYIESFGEKEWQIYVYGMMDLAKTFLPYVLPKLDVPANARKLLDLGGSHGLYSIELCKRNTGLHATLVDFPQVLKFTKKIIEEHRMSDRIELEAANVLDRAYVGSAFDTVLAFNIVHGLRPDQIGVLLKNAQETLRPGGHLYILDQFLTDRGSALRQFVPLMVGINIMNEVGGRAYGVEELRGYSDAAGFRAFRVVRLSLPGVSLVELKK